MADALALNNMSASDTLAETKGWSKNIQHMMKEDHATKDQGYSIARAEPAYTARLFAINESLMLKKKLTYASLELLVVIARAEKTSGRVDWARLVFSNVKWELNAINREQVASSKCAPILTQILKYWLQTRPIAVHKAIQDVPSSSRKKSGKKKEEPVEVGRKRITRATEDTQQKRTRTGATTRASQMEGPGRTSTKGTVLPVPWNITTMEPGPRARPFVVQESSSEEEDEDDVPLIRRRQPPQITGTATTNAPGRAGQGWSVSATPLRVVSPDLDLPKRLNNSVGASLRNPSPLEIPIGESTIPLSPTSRPKMRTRRVAPPREGSSPAPEPRTEQESENVRPKIMEEDGEDQPGSEEELRGPSQEGQNHESPVEEVILEMAKMDWYETTPSVLQRRVRDMK